MERKRISSTNLHSASEGRCILIQDPYHGTVLWGLGCLHILMNMFTSYLKNSYGKLKLPMCVCYLVGKVVDDSSSCGKIHAGSQALRRHRQKGISSNVKIMENQDRCLHY